jgi:hypothetical protein
VIVVFVLALVLVLVLTVIAAVWCIISAVIFVVCALGITITVEIARRVLALIRRGGGRRPSN